jgi:AcrR family transcriptional regulator
MARTISDSQILDAALDVLAQHGYDGATTREIAAAAGINAVTLFRRFSTKKALLLAAVEREAAGFSASGVAYTGDVEADLARIARFYEELLRRRGRVMVMLLNEIPRHPDLLEILQTPLELLAKITALIERYQREGALVAEPPMQAFAALAGPIFLRGTLGSIRPDLFDASFDARRHVRSFLAGRATPKEEG